MPGACTRLKLGLCAVRVPPAAACLGADSAAVRDAGGSLTGVIHMLAKATVARWEAIEAQRREVAELRIRHSQLTMDVALAQGELRRLDDAKSQFAQLRHTKCATPSPR